MSHVPTRAGGSRARTALLALAAALTLALTTLVTPARAADPAPITGTVVFPSGYTWSAEKPPRIGLLEYVGGWSGVWPAHGSGGLTPVRQDGTFTVRDIRLRDGADFVLVLQDDQRRLVSGYAGNGTVQQLDQAFKVRAGDSVRFSATLGVQVTGRIRTPASFTQVSELQIEGLVGTDGGRGRSVLGTVNDDGTFVVGGLLPGAAVRLRVAPFGDLYTGVWNPDDGYFLDDANDEGAGSVTAPRSGLTLALNRMADLTGRVEVADRGLGDGSISVQAWTGPDAGRWIRWDPLAPGGVTFTFTNLDSGRGYALLVGSPDAVEGGVVRADGTVFPAATVAEGWAQAGLVRPGAGDVVVRPVRKTGLRGRVQLPEGYTLTSSRVLRAVLLTRSVGASTWVERTGTPVYADGTFDFSGFWVQRNEHVVRLESADGSSTPLLTGYWTGSTTAPVADPDAATPVTESKTRDIVFPVKVANTVRPAISGTARVGSTLQVGTGSWSPSSVTTSVQWLRDGTAISGATSTSYTVQPADDGARLSARVTARGGTGWVPTSVTTAAVRVVEPIANVTRVSVSGTVAYGKTVWVKRGEWTPAPASTSVQWLRDGTAINGATGSSYKVTKADWARSCPCG